MEFLKKKLSNGISVVMEKRDLSVVSVSITNRFGGAYESSDVKGVAHFIEHLLFTGTKNRTHEDISREIEKRGGILNAFTNHEVTSFWFKLPSEYIFEGLDILIDMLNNSIFDEEKFEKEKKVIIEEIKMYHDNPRMSAYEQIEKNMFEKPFGELIIGNRETVSSLTRKQVVELFNRVYCPENFIVSIVGNADFDKICDYLEKKFSKKENKFDMNKIKTRNSESVDEREGIDQAHFVFALHAPLPGTREFTALQILDAYLADGMSSRLFLEIREKRGLAYAVKSDISTEKNYCSYLIYVGTTKEAVQEVRKLIIEEFKKVKDMSEKDLKEAKQRLIGLKRVYSEESTNVMNELMYEEYRKDAREYYKFEEIVNSIKLDEVKKLAEIKEFSSATIVPK